MCWCGEGREVLEDMTQPFPLLVLAPSAARSDIPTPLSAAVFRAKVTVLQMQRALRNLRARVRACPKSDGTGFATTVAQSRTKLWSDERDAERVYQLGKVQNLRRACAKHLARAAATRRARRSPGGGCELGRRECVLRMADHGDWGLGIRDWDDRSQSPIPNP